MSDGECPGGRVLTLDAGSVILLHLGPVTVVLAPDRDELLQVAKQVVVGARQIHLHIFFLFFFG